MHHNKPGLALRRHKGKKPARVLSSPKTMPNPPHTVELCPPQNSTAGYWLSVALRLKASIALLEAHAHKCGCVWAAAFLSDLQPELRKMANRAMQAVSESNDLATGNNFRQVYLTGNPGPANPTGYSCTHKGNSQKT